MPSLRPRLRALAMVIALLAAGRSALASPHVLLLESRSSTPGLRDALRIQLPHGTVLDVEAFEVRGTVAVRVRAARARLAQRRGLMAVWVEEWPLVEAEREVVAYFVARTGDRALIEIVRVRGTSDDELERAVAIKGLEVFEAIDDGADIGVLEPFSQSSRSAPARPPPAAPGERLGAAPLVQLGALAALGPGGTSLRGMLEAGAGVALLVGDARAEVLGLVRRATSFSERSAAGELVVEQTYVGGALRWARDLGAFRLGAFCGGGVWFLRVEGETRLGATGGLERSLPSVRLGPEARLELVPWLDARLAVGEELMLRRQRFAVNGEPLLDMGSHRISVELGVVATLW